MYVVYEWGGGGEKIIKIVRITRSSSTTGVNVALRVQETGGTGAVCAAQACVELVKDVWLDVNIYIYIPTYGRIPLHRRYCRRIFIPSRGTGRQNNRYARTDET